MAKQYKDFVEYLNKNHLNLFVAAFHNVAKDKEKLYSYLRTTRQFDLNIFDYVDANVKKIQAYYQPEDRLLFDAVVQYIFKTVIIINNTRKNIDISFKITFTVDSILKDGLHNLKIVGIRGGDVAGQASDNIMTNDFIPYISSDELDRYAEEFLMEYYPEALFDLVNVNPYEVIKNMGLTYYQAPLRKDLFGMTIFGGVKTKIYNEDNDVIEVNLNAGTILANPDDAFSSNEGRYNNTLIHECVHWYLHRKYFELQKLLDPDLYTMYISCNVSDIGLNKSQIKKNAKKWMEWQANNIAPHILVPSKTAREFIYEQYERIKKECSDYSKPEQVRKVIDTVADHYGVSHTVAKIRAIQLGFDLAKGVYNCIDGNWSESYSFPDGILNKNQTYQIGKKSFIQLLSNNPILADAYSNGLIDYIQGFVIINSPDLLVRIGPVKWIRDYILEDVSKYCFCFNIKSSISEPDDNSEVVYLCRTNGCNFEEVKCDLSQQENYSVLYKIKDEINEEKDSILRAKEVAKEYAEIMRTLPADFGGTLKAHIKRRGYTYEQVEEQTLISRKTIGEYINNVGANPDFESVLALCIGLNLTYNFSYNLIQKAGFAPRLTREDSWIYFELLTRDFNRNIHYWNEKLLAAGMKRIPSEDKAEKVYADFW